MDINFIIQIISIFVAVIIFLITNIINKIHDRKVANREIYQRLELASIDLFRFESEHIEIIRPIWEAKVMIPSDGSAERIVVFNYICQILNLFEMAIRFRKERIMPAEIFGSWIIWYFDLCEAPHFPEIWEQVRWNYASELRKIINKGICIIQKEPNELKRRTEFYNHISKTLKCPIIKAWVKQLEYEKIQIKNGELE